MRKTELDTISLLWQNFVDYIRDDEGLLAQKHDDDEKKESQKRKRKPRMLIELLHPQK